MVGTFATGSRLLTVTLYGDANGNTKLWQTVMNTQVDSTGVFNCTLGTAENPLPQPSAMDRPIWLGVAVDNGPELRPLSQVTASAYALNVVDNAITTAKLADGAVTTTKLSDGMVTSQKLATGAVESTNLSDSSVTSAKLAHGSVTSDKMDLNYIASISVNGTPVTGIGSNLNIANGDGINVSWDETTNSLYLSRSAQSNGPDKSATPLAGNIVAYWNGTIAVAGVTGATNKVLHGDGGGAGPSWGLVNLASEVVGVLPVANGGTGSSSVSTWNLTGNAATVGNFIGTTNTTTFVQKTNNTIALQLISTGGATSIPNIIGGLGNTIVNSSGNIGSIIAGGGGSAGITSDPNSIVAPDDASTISGGEGNTITNVTVQGVNVNEGNDGHVIGGGISNSIVTDNVGVGRTGPGAAGTIAGGQGNLLCGPYWGAIAGGQNNLISSSNPNADDDNAISIQMGFIGGGKSNSIGGLLNAPNQFGSFCVIAGGQNNHIGGGTVVGGTPIGLNGVLRGGAVVNPADDATIAGGASNISSAPYTFIGGGLGNKTMPSGTSDGSGATIAGGWNNIASYRFSNIPGGINLTTSAEAQTVIGAGNIDAGHAHLIYWTGFAPNDDRVLEIGSPYWSGTNWVTNNAFEVSYNGHSIVYHTNGSSMGTGAVVLQGATYVESPVYAWGEFDAAGGEMSSFGVSQVISLVPNGAPPGTYLVTLAPADPHGGATPDVTRASITVTIVNDLTSDITSQPASPPPLMTPQYVDVSKPIPDSVILASGGTTSNPDTSTRRSPAPATPTTPLAATTTCGYATASSIGILVPLYGATFARSFIVRTYQVGTGSCQQTPLAFYLKVCHR